MKAFSVALALGVVGAALLVATVALAKWAGFEVSSPVIIWQLAGDSLSLVRLALLLQLCSLLATPILFAVGLSSTTSKREGSDGLSVLQFSAPGLGLLAAAYAGWIVYVAMVRTHTVSFLVIAPSVAQLLLVLGVGFLAGAVAAAANAMLLARARRA